MERIETGAQCVVCRGEIVEKFEMVFDATTGPLIIGPSSRSQHRRVSKGFHCSVCKIQYESLPDCVPEEARMLEDSGTDLSDILQLGEVD